MADEPYKIEHVNRRAIEGQVLASLAEDKNKVAILATREDLDILLEALESYEGPDARRAEMLDFAKGMRVLYKNVYGNENQTTHPRRTRTRKH